MSINNEAIRANLKYVWAAITGEIDAEKDFLVRVLNIAEQQSESRHLSAKIKNISQLIQKTELIDLSEVEFSVKSTLEEIAL